MYSYIFIYIYTYTCINEYQYHPCVCVELKKFIDSVKEEQSKNFYLVTTVIKFKV